MSVRTKVNLAAGDAYRQLRDEKQQEADSAIPGAITVSLAPGREYYTFKADVDPSQIPPFSPEDVVVYLGGLGIAPDAINGLPAPEAEA